MAVFPSLPDDYDLFHIFKRFPKSIKPLMEYHDILLRGESAFSVGEREMIAAYVSSLNDCRYCFGAHSAIAAAFEIERAVFETGGLDPDHLEIPEKMRPVLRYVEKLTRSPHAIGDADAKAVYDAGWDEEALFDAIAVCALFNLMNRLVEGSGIKEYNPSFEMTDEMRRKFRYGNIARNLDR